MRNILITSALPYVNNVPHLGNIIGSVLSADCYARCYYIKIKLCRYCRLRGYQTLYICGTDEYGTATEIKAVEEGLSCEDLCQKYHKIHVDVYKWFNISFDYFGRTSTKQHTIIAQEIFLNLYKNNFLQEDVIDQFFCQNCQRFLADRFVEGTCPFCLFEDAQGDQCDNCGKIFNSTELKMARCKICKQPPIIRSSKHLFLDLPSIEPRLKEFIDKAQITAKYSGKWSANAVAITNSWMKDGLKKRCITRDLKWGTPVPLNEFKEKVLYVWFDAPIGYISITANYTQHWEKWWKNPSVKLTNFMGKDNVIFHTIIFPATLIAAQCDYIYLNDISSTEYLNYEKGKFSKSRGTGVFGDNAMDTHIKSDIFRIYLLANRPESQDTSFMWEDLISRNNNEIIKNIGNFINRCLSLLYRKFDGKIQEISLTITEFALITKIDSLLRFYVDSMEFHRFREAFAYLLDVSHAGNQYFQFTKPWELDEKNPEEWFDFVNPSIYFTQIDPKYVQVLKDKHGGQSADTISKIVSTNNINCTPIVARLLGLIVKGVEEDPSWLEKAIKSMAKKLRKTRQLEEFEKVLHTKDPLSRCITITRSLDGRLQIAHRKVLPHVAYCRIFRWPDLHSYHELKSLGNCEYSFQRKKDLLCINPYHYYRAELLNCSQSHFMTDTTKMSGFYQNIDPYKQLYSDMQMNGIVVNTTIGFSEQHLFNSPIMAPLSLICDSSKDNVIDPIYKIFLIILINFCDNFTHQTHTTTFSPQKNYEMENITQTQAEVDKLVANSILPALKKYLINSVNYDSYHIINYQTCKYWCAVNYYEYHKKRGISYASNSKVINIDFGTEEISPSCYGLKSFKTLNKNDEFTLFKSSLGNSLKLTHGGGEVIIECLAKSVAVFVCSSNFNLKNNKPYNSVHRLERGDTITVKIIIIDIEVFDYHDFAPLLARCIAHSYEAVYRLLSWTIIRVSFIKGWGPNFKRQSPDDTPMWFEIKLIGPMNWLDRIIRQLVSPASKCSSI
ncbi:hypothetical protein MXB_370, partial [Myxobolus squamalis]